MCGIAGVYSSTGEPVSASHVQGMMDLLRHRGPDDAGVWSAGPVALGHRRLSIIDLSPRGRNPIPNEDETVWIVFNGEVYNYRELRADLVARGHRFRSDTDTEVVLHLYEEYGVDSVAKLNGMFAFALYDARPRAAGRPRAGTLLLARDRFGVKPLYWTRVGDTIAFASEAKAFLALPEFRARPDPLALVEHFTFQFSLGSRTLFEGVNLVEAGHTLTFQDGTVRDREYWDLRFAPDEGRSFEETARGLRERFEVAVERQLMSERPLGTFLSGGMDTGAISAVAARRIPRMHTFTCGFRVPERASDLERYFDERTESRELSSRLGTVHHELELGPEAFLPALPHVVWHLDEPRVGISYQVYYTADMIHDHVIVVLSGVGGDELFAGYPWRYERVLGEQPGRFADAYYRLWMRFFESDDERRDLFTDAVNGPLGDYTPREGFGRILERSAGASPLHRALYFDFKTFMNGLLLVDDKLSMAHSIESRVPFLDNDLVDYVATIPSSMKLQGATGKAVLRRAMQGLLPEAILERRKQGFTPPDETWYKQHHAGSIEKLILAPRALERGYFQPRALRRILDDHNSGRRNNRFLIWSLMCFEWWNRLFVDRDPLPSPPPMIPERA